MRYSSHLYLRTDGTLGRYPIIEVDDTNTVVSIRECGDTLCEQAGTRFYAGVIVAGDETAGALHFNSREEFAIAMKGREIREGDNRGLCLISDFDLNTFKGETARERQLTKKLHIS